MSISDPRNRDRLDALLSYEILDTPPERSYDDIVELAQIVCNAPVALMSLVTADRQWFKAGLGLEICETPIGQSVCAHALREDEILVIPDLARDRRTVDNTLVTGDPHIRFYAGAVLRTPERIPLGALCVIDTVPRPQGLTRQQRAALLALARQVMDRLELRRAVATRDQALSHATLMGIAQDAGRVGTFEVDIASDRLAVSPTFCRVFGIAVSPSITAGTIEALVIPEDRTVHSNASTRREGQSSLDVEYRIRRPDDGTVRWIARRAAFKRDAQGKPVKLAGTVQDVSERKAKEAERRLLNEELSHRMKNTLAMVDAIALQTLRGTADPEALENFSQRIKALSRAHDILLQETWTAAPLIQTVRGSVALHAGLDRFDIAGPDLSLDAKAVVQLSLLLHELATNALKYGALSMPAGRVAIAWSVDGAATPPAIEFIWREQGGPPAAPPARRGFGSRLISAGLFGTGDAALAYEPMGFRAIFRAPLSYLTSD